MDNLWITCYISNLISHCDILVRWIIAIVKCFTWHDKNTIILYYYSMSNTIMGRGLHFRTSIRKPGRAYLFNPQTPCKISVFEAFHPNSTQNTTSISTSTKPWKIKHFITFNTIKNHQYFTLRSTQTLINKAFSRTPPKTLYLIMK